jgi:hypothetical protein
MTRQMSHARVLQWYPRAWRERYGDELLALMEDTYGDQPLTLRTRWSLARAGLIERARGGGWVGHSTTPEDRVRAGALVVVAAWTALVIAGSAFAKLSEHFTDSLPSTSSAVAEDAWRTVQVTAGVATIAVVLGALVAVPAFLRARRDRQLGDLRRHVIGVLTAAASVIIATVGLVAWAHTQSSSARQTGAGFYGAAFIAWATLVVLLIVSCAALAVGLARRVSFTSAELAAESLLADIVTLAIVVITAAIAIWWGAVATTAPWFLHGAPIGARGSGFDLRVCIVVTVAGASVATAAYGVARMSRAWMEIRTA